MNRASKSQAEILEKLGIEQLNEMQELTAETIRTWPEVVLLSPTGTGKTLAFLLPIIESLDPDLEEVQALILAPSRELAMQIEQVVREMGAGFKANALYGGRAVSQDKLDLRQAPAILIGTPGRIADHFRRGSFSKEHIHTLVLDEFDKSLEIGFEGEMSEIMGMLPPLKRKVLTSATYGIDIPAFVGLEREATLDFLEEKSSQLQIKRIVSPDKDKLETLLAALKHLGEQSGIVFCNFKDSIQRVSEFLEVNGIAHGCFHGGLEQIDRERALIKFRNGTHRLILATDLAARGLDVPEIGFILHYHLPIKAEEFTHRNGRTARMHSSGSAYVLHWEGEELPDFVGNADAVALEDKPLPAASPWRTLFISGGRRDKISKGDIAGLFLKQGKLPKEALGTIELKQDCAFVGVKASKVKALLPLVDRTRLKKKKVRVRPV